MNTTFELPIRDTIELAWKKVYGAKGTIWGGYAIMFVIVLCLSILIALIKTMVLGDTTPYDPKNPGAAGHFVKFIAYLVAVGVMYMGLRKASDQPIDIKMTFYGFKPDIIWKVIVLFLLQVLVMVPVIILMVAAIIITQVYPTLWFISFLCYLTATCLAIFLSIRISQSLFCILDKNLMPVDALKRSFHITKGNTFRLIGIYIALGVVVLISALPALIGLIWTVPLVPITQGLVYKKLISSAS